MPKDHAESPPISERTVKEVNFMSVNQKWIVITCLGLLASLLLSQRGLKVVTYYQKGTQVH